MPPAAHRPQCSCCLVRAVESRRRRRLPSPSPTSPLPPRFTRSCGESSPPWVAVPLAATGRSRTSPTPSPASTAVCRVRCCLPARNPPRFQPRRAAAHLPPLPSLATPARFLSRNSRDSSQAHGLWTASEAGCFLRQLRLLEAGRSTRPPAQRAASAARASSGVAVCTGTVGCTPAHQQQHPCAASNCAATTA